MYKGSCWTEMPFGTNWSPLERCPLHRTSHNLFLGDVSTDVTLTCQLFIKCSWCPSMRERESSFLLFNVQFYIFAVHVVFVHPTVERLTLGSFFAMLIMQEELCEKGLCVSVTYVTNRVISFKLIFPLWVTRWPLQSTFLSLSLFCIQYLK